MNITNNITPDIVVFNINTNAGISSILRNIIQYKPESEIGYKLILYSFEENRLNPVNDNWCEQVERIQFSKNDNLFHTIKKLKKQINPDSIIIANDISELRMAALLKLRNPLIYIIHGDFETYYKHCEFFQDYMDLIISYSKHIADKLKTKLKPENVDKIKLIYYPVPEIEVFAKHNGIIKIVFAGSLTHRKGVDVLPLIIAELNNSNIKYQLTIIGSGEEEEGLKQQLNQNKNVIFAGQKSNDDVIELFIQSDILLFPTRSEGLPSVLIEAMKAGCVPVTSNIKSGIPDVVEDGINGFMLDTNEPDQFAKKIIELANSPETLKTLRNKAIEKANKMFDPYKNAKAYFDAFLSVTHKHTIPIAKIPKGPILNQSFLPNWFVKNIRKLKINRNI
jgi:glycosyltransferase involved in cell wall biosynthesis